VTVVLGSIAGLAIAIIAISAVLILVSWGFLAPVLLPVISICSTVAATVGPWAITAAEIALVLNGLVFIKNLVDAATAPTAAELQKESMAMGEDVNAMGMMAMQIAGDHLGKAVGPAVVRNLVKRRLRHLVRDRLSGLPAGSLIVVRALPQAASASYQDLKRDLDAALKRLLKAEPAVTAPTGAGR